MNDKKTTDVEVYVRLPKRFSKEIDILMLRLDPYSCLSELSILHEALTPDYVSIRERDHGTSWRWDLNDHKREFHANYIEHIQNDVQEYVKKTTK